VSELPINRHYGFFFQKVSPIHSSSPSFLADSRSWGRNKVLYLICSRPSLAVIKLPEADQGHFLSFIGSF
jgi:hypothetical protein